MLCHGGDRLWDRACRSPDARVLKKYHLSSPRQRVGHRRIPIVERAGKVLQKKKRIARAVPETAKGVTLLADLEKLSDRCDVARCHTDLRTFLHRARVAWWQVGQKAATAICGAAQALRPSSLHDRQMQVFRSSL